MVPLVLSFLKNFTIDDTFGDPTTGAQFVYLPHWAWTVGQACSNCTSQPNPAEAFNGTWHGALPESAGLNSQVNASVTFNGSAVYVFCIVDNTSDQPWSLLFSIDDTPLDIREELTTATGDTNFSYNVMVFHSLAITPGIHTLTVTSGRGPASPFFLDYVMYTSVDDDEVANSSSSSLGIAAFSASPALHHLNPSPSSSVSSSPDSETQPTADPSSTRFSAASSTPQTTLSSSLLPTTSSLSASVTLMTASATAYSPTSSNLSSAVSTSDTVVITSQPAQAQEGSHNTHISRRSRKTIIAAAVAAPVVVFSLVLLIAWCYRRRRSVRGAASQLVVAGGYDSRTVSDLVLDRRSSLKASQRGPIPDDRYIRPFWRSDHRRSAVELTRVQTASTVVTTGSTVLPPYSEHEPMPVLDRYQLASLVIPSFRMTSLRNSLESTEPPPPPIWDTPDAVGIPTVGAESRNTSAFGFLDSPIDVGDVESGRSSPSSPARSDSIHTVGTTLGRVTSGYSQAFDLSEAALQLKSLRQLLTNRPQDALNRSDQQAVRTLSPPYASG
ncbi:hypothetical protein OBBRIDRAFT_890317 [Obba rivulosa]|uniref:Uncharacterized protein n=1 Tax=Obba rivulosa TaxID=1052685 RepID=A0A8E2DH46_9APHY|nr:hypothetical protein OBBRIDRAFT_890317 [Obba rivulosa]